MGQQATQFLQKGGYPSAIGRQARRRNKQRAQDLVDRKPLTEQPPRRDGQKLPLKSSTIRAIKTFVHHWGRPRLRLTAYRARYPRRSLPIRPLRYHCVVVCAEPPQNTLYPIYLCNSSPPKRTSSLATRTIDTSTITATTFEFPKRHKSLSVSRRTVARFCRSTPPKNAHCSAPLAARSPWHGQPHPSRLMHDRPSHRKQPPLR
jgi:hypothetical protein